jgi:hypothetical protein
VTWNIEGIESKLSDNGFIGYLKTFDVIGLVETWATGSEKLQQVFDDYHVYNCSAKNSNRGGRNMGGVVVLIRNVYNNLIKRVCCEYEFGVLLQVNGTLFDVERDVLFICAYLPPAGSPFYSPNDASGITCLEDALIGVDNIHSLDLLICGDFNARTGELNDFVITDKHTPLFDEFRDFLGETVTTVRKSCDRVINKPGRDLLDLCKTYGVSIVNGRIGQDLGKGEYTYIDTTGCSVIDYYLVSITLFDKIVDFCVENRTDCKHLPLTCTLETKFIGTGELRDIKPKESVYYKFSNAEEENEFISNVNECILNGQFDDFDHSLRDYGSNIDEVLDNFECLVLNCSEKAKKVKVHHTNRKIKRKWFDQECNVLRKEKNRCLRKFRKTRLERDLNIYVDSRKVFNKVCKSKKRAHDRNIVTEIADSVSNQKKFWNTIKFSLGSDRINPRIGINEWYDHFKVVFQPAMETNDGDVNDDYVNNADVTDNDENNDNVLFGPDFDVFNSEITDAEIVYAISDLKKNKASSGLLTAEHFKLCSSMLLPYIRILFNRLFTTGVFPEKWSLSVIIPLHKKGPSNIPDNYRGIALLQVFSKIYIGILNKRITLFAEACGKIAEAQAGFRSGYSTIDNGFILYSVVSKYLCRKGRSVYVAFVDFKKAFDSVNRNKLFKALSRCGVKGRLYNAIKSIYTSVKGMVRDGADLSDVFECPIGLRQGCKLSPILFSLFINELHETLANSDLYGIQLTPDLIQIFTLLFADDVALISDTVNGLQKQLGILSNYCTEWQLSVNTQKTKIVVFKNGGRLSRHERWSFNGENIDTVNGFDFVGFYFSSTLSLYKMSESMAVKAKRALVCILASLHHLMPLQRHAYFKLFDAKIAPILLYGSELWGLNYMQEIERVHLYACKRFMSAPLRACNAVVYGDCERFPMFVLAAKRSIKYWLKVANMPSYRYVKKCYNMLLYYDSIGKSNWVTKVKSHLYENGFGIVWEQQNVGNHALFLNEYTQRLKDQYIQKWNDSCETTSKLASYNMYKNTFEYEKYLDVLDIRKFRYTFAAFRSSCHLLMIEAGRHIGIEQDERTCYNCQNTIETEYHFLLECPVYYSLRDQYIPRKFYNPPSRNKFCILMASRKDSLIKALAMYIYYGMQVRKQKLSESGL